MNQANKLLIYYNSKFKNFLNIDLYHVIFMSTITNENQLFNKSLKMINNQETWWILIDNIHVNIREQLTKEIVNHESS